MSTFRTSRTERRYATLGWFSRSRGCGAVGSAASRVIVDICDLVRETRQ